MTAFDRVSSTEIQWHDGQKTHSVRHFPQLGTLIWSSWALATTAPQFDEGTRQQVGDFLQHGAPPSLHVPEEVLHALREMLKPKPEKRGLFRWWKRP